MIASILFSAHLYGSVSRAPVADLPLTVPLGWSSAKQDGSVLLTPKDLGAGKVFSVVATAMTTKAGSLDEIYAAGKAMMAEVGTYEALANPPVQKSDGGWDYKFTVGTLTSGGKSLLAQVTGVKKGDEGGTVIVLSDSLETMQKYGDDLGRMLRTLGGAAKPPPTLTVETPSGSVDLSFTAAPGWTVQKKPGATIVEASKDEFYDKYRWTLIVLPTVTLKGKLRDAFRDYWDALVGSQFKSKIVPLPLMSRLANGNVIAFDGDDTAEHKTHGGRPQEVCVYLVARGNKYTPILAVLYGYDKKLEADVKQMLESAQIPGASGAMPAIFNAAELPAHWSEGSASFANYVTSSGAYAGDATVYTGSHLILKADGSFQRTFIGISSTSRMKETSEGKWSVRGEELVLRSSKGVDVYSLLGYGNDPKAGRFLVLSQYANQPSKIRWTNPRGPFQATWYKVK